MSANREIEPAMHGKLCGGQGQRGIAVTRLKYRG
jgi:hypothetical protein